MADRNQWWLPQPHETAAQRESRLRRIATEQAGFRGTVAPRSCSMARKAESGTEVFRMA